MLPFDDNLARRQVEEIDAKVLSNRKPPYPPAGGLYDALTQSGGDVLLASNRQAREAAQLFLETEGIDIHPAAAVATATLIEAANHGLPDKSLSVMLNITGGGENLFKANKNLYYKRPEIVFPLNTECTDVVETVKKLF